MQSNIEDLVQCAVCLGTLSQPKHLPCSHTFCKLCLVDLARTEDRSPRGARGPRLTCPVCRQQHRIDPSGVDALPDNLIARNLVDLVSTDRTVCEECGAKTTADMCDHCHNHKHVCLRCGEKHVNLAPQLKTAIDRMDKLFDPLTTHEPPNSRTLLDQLQRIEQQRRDMNMYFESEKEKLSRRQKTLDGYLTMVCMLYLDNLKDSTLSSELSNRMGECPSADALEKLNFNLSDVTDALKLIRSREKGSFTFVPGQPIDANAIGEIRFNQDTVNIRGSHAQYSVVTASASGADVDASTSNHGRTGATFVGGNIAFVRDQSTPHQRFPRNVNYRNKTRGHVFDLVVDGQRLRFPTCCTYHVQRDELYIALSTNRVLVCAPDGRHDARPFYVGRVDDVAVSTCGRYVYVLRYDGDRDVVDQRDVNDGSLIRSIDSYPAPLSSSLQNCYCIVCHDNCLAVWSNDDNRIIVFNTASGHYVRHFDVHDIGLVEYMTVDREGCLYLSDRCTGCITVYSWDGERMETFGESEDSTTRGICVDGDGRVCVVRRDSELVDVYDRRRRHASTIGGPGEESGCLQDPQGLCVLPDGRLVVCDYGNDRMQIF